MKNKPLHCILTVLLTVSLPAGACLNETGTNHRGERVDLPTIGGQSLKPRLTTPATKATLVAWSAQVIQSARTQPSFYSLNNLAVVLIRHGRLTEAVSLLQFLERKYPGNYETASNVGTAYELMGRNEEALKWILEGLKRNPRDHFGTEWLHVQILKATLGRLPKPLPGQSILNLDFGNGALPNRPTSLPLGNAGKPASLFAVGLALRYQLLERIAFVPAPDPIVAELLLDWANLELLAGTVESADVLYDAAIRYGSKEGRTIAIRKAQVARILVQANAKPGSVPGLCELCQPPDAMRDKE